MPAIEVVWGFELFFSSSSQKEEDENDGDDDDYKNFTLAEQYSEHFGFVSGFMQPYVQNEITGSV